jgi:hypothetical protein
MLKNNDPDFLICPESWNTMNYMFERTKCLNLNLGFGRYAMDFKRLDRPIPSWSRGRVVLDYGFFEEYGVAGLVERARFSVLPPGIAARWTANRVIDSRNCYELLRRNPVIPKNTGYYEYIRTIRDLVDYLRRGSQYPRKWGEGRPPSPCSKLSGGYSVHRL